MSDPRQRWDDPANDRRMWRWLIAFGLGLPTALVVASLFPLRQSDQGQSLGWIASMIVALGAVWFVSGLIEAWWERRRVARRTAERPGSRS